MATFAFAWELGDNYGHLSRILPIAERLRADDHTIVFAIRDLALAHAQLTPRGFSFIAAPSLIRSPTTSRAPVSYAHLLAEYGFCHLEGLRAAIRAWQTLWSTVDAVIIDHAPTALLAARILQLPTTLFGTGFTIPPDQSPLPALRPWVPAPPAVLQRFDAAVLATINTVICDYGRRPLARIADLFTGLPALITNFAALDPCASRTACTFLGPIDAPEQRMSVQWTSERHPRVFAYLRPDMPGFDCLLSALGALPGETICVIPGASAALQQRLRTSALRLYVDPLDLLDLLRDSDAVVSYGSAGLIAQSLASGVPVLVLPHTLEHLLNGQRIAQIGAGQVLDATASESTIRRALQDLFGDPRMRQAAIRFAEQHAKVDQAEMIDHATQIIARSARARRASSHRSDNRCVLYAWELGGGTGAMERAVAIADYLRRRQREIVVAVRDPVAADQILTPAGLRFVTCPLAAHRSARRSPTNYAEALLAEGFSDVVDLGARVSAWIELYARLEPDVVLLDHAPTAQLAALVSERPSLLLGTGWSVPTPSGPVAITHETRANTQRKCVKSDGDLLVEHTNHVLETFRRPPLARIEDLFAHTPLLLTTFRELDPYAHRKDGCYIGPLASPTRNRATWRTHAPIKVLAHLPLDLRHLGALWIALDAFNAEVQCVPTDTSPRSFTRALPAAVTVHTDPIDCTSLLSDATITVSVGDPDVIAPSLLAGIPLLLLSQTPEQRLHARRVLDLDAGIEVPQPHTATALISALRSLTADDSRYRLAAKRFAESYRAPRTLAFDLIERAMEGCLENPHRFAGTDEH